MRHLINTAIRLLFATIAANAQNESKTKPNGYAETLALYEPGEFKGVQYRLMKPIDFDPGKTYPLILSLHGGSGHGYKQYLSSPYTRVELGSSAHSWLRRGKWDHGIPRLYIPR